VSKALRYKTSVKKPGWNDRILCGDCRDVLRGMPDGCVHLAITSPPYNVGLEYDGHNDRMSYDEYLAWLRPVWRELYRVLVDGGPFGQFIPDSGIRTALTERSTGNGEYPERRAC
jgi:site-specific DNA-methyltransferase (adenine-specific)